MFWDLTNIWQCWPINSCHHTLIAIVWPVWYIDMDRPGSIRVWWCSSLCQSFKFARCKKLIVFAGTRRTCSSKPLIALFAFCFQVAQPEILNRRTSKSRNYFFAVMFAGFGVMLLVLVFSGGPARNIEWTCCTNSDIKIKKLFCCHNFWSTWCNVFWRYFLWSSDKADTAGREEEVIATDL